MSDSVKQNESNLLETDSIDASIETELQDAYLEYAMSVIASRALPDVRDGLKPVQRRILYAMGDINLAHNKPYKKSAKVIGEVISKYHPHGDSSIYDALVRLAQDFSMGTPLIDGQGNFGSIDDDPPAAMRYTEVRLRKITHRLLEDIDKDTVDYKDNYDGSETEPSVLPAAFPQILANGSEGIAVGMATNIPPHNLGEIINACLYVLNTNPNATKEELKEIVKAPDFPTGGIIINGIEAAHAIATGRGSVIMRGKVEIETLRNGKEAIIITEIPYQVVKSRLIEKIGDLVKNKRIEGISSLRDESNKKGIRVVVELKRDAYAQVVLNHLYTLTPLQSNFAVNSLVLNNNCPELMGVEQIIKTFLTFRKSVIKRRIKYALHKVRERSHTLIGLRVAVDSIDKIISIIRNSPDQASARKTLLEESWPVENQMLKLFALVDDHRNVIIDNRFHFTEEQVRAILDMKLAKLTGLERERISEELEFHGAEMTKYLAILADKQKLIEIISKELEEMQREFAIPRRTKIENISINKKIEDFIEPEEVLILITQNGYIKRNSLDGYGVQKRGGKGKTGLKIKVGDRVANILISHTHADMLLFSDRGIVYKIKTHTIPTGTNQSQGRAIANLLPLQPEEKIREILPVSFEQVNDDFLIFATKNGNVRKSSIQDFENIQSNGKIAIKLGDDQLIGVKRATEDHDILLATANGLAIRFPVKDLRLIKSRSSDGVKGINLQKGDSVISISIILHAKEGSDIREKYLSIPTNTRIKLQELLKDEDPESQDKNNQKISQKLEKIKERIDLDKDQIKKMISIEEFILTITSNGLGKKTSAYEYRITNRGGKGIKNIILSSRASVIASFVSEAEDNIILTSTNGKIIRCKISNVPIIGRSTKGVKIFNIEGKEAVVSVARIPGDNEEESEEKESTKSRESENQSTQASML